MHEKLGTEAGDEVNNCFAIRGEIGGRGGTRTPDPLLAKQVLCQLSYTPMVEKMGFSLPVLEASHSRCI